ncbi:putative CO dehydrogenase/acetyl-CoA synthase subunit alpha 1 [groundwater metagenome]|uniref:Putative CO dehydrogenase/acetyl-CoA synthase subunit alpha 1 n=1 Tax=groundwater metagenome TaxID=717931 RepID=A0A098E7Y8_9ZZZZ
MAIKSKNLKISIGEVEEEREYKELEGPTPNPDIADLRDWDLKLLNRYKPKYYGFIQQCQFCALGPCDLSDNRKGACGMTLERHLAREGLQLAITGASAHAAHGRHLIEALIEKSGRNFPLDTAENTEVKSPNIQLVCGYKQETIGDLERGLNYIEGQITKLASCLNVGTESSDFDFNSKALHAGMLDHVGMEICDIAQIAALNFPKGDPNPKLAEFGFGSVNKEKPVILCIGHNVLAGASAIDYAEANNKDVEICGICCTALDLGRYRTGAKIVGPLSYQIPYIRSGIADIVISDEQCIRVDILENLKKLKTPLIATTDKYVSGLEDLSDENSEVIIEKLMSGEIPGCYLHTLEKLGEVAVKVAVMIKERKINERKRAENHNDGKTQNLNLNLYEGAIKKTSDCINCGLCIKSCPVGVDNRLIIRSINKIFNEKESETNEKAKDEKAKDEKAEENKAESKAQFLFCWEDVSENNVDFIKFLKRWNIESKDIAISKEDNVVRVIDKCTNSDLLAIKIKDNIIVEIKNEKFEFIVREENGKPNIYEEAGKLKNKIINLLRQKEYDITSLAKEIGCSRQYIYNVLEKISKEKNNEISKRAVGKNTYYSLIKGLNEYYKITERVKECVECGNCTRNCPNNIQISDLIIPIKEGKEIGAREISILKNCAMCGLCQEKCPKKINIKEVVRVERERTGIKDELKFLTREEILESIGKCIFCGRCESWCPKQIPIVSVFIEIYKDRLANDKAKISPGRGAIQDVEIRNVGQPIVFGEIPGILAAVGCSIWPNGGKELGEILEEFIKRNFIVVVSGCSAMAAASDYSGTYNLFEKYGGNFGPGNLVNVGSCVSNSHITGAAMKVANIFAKRNLRANFEEIADYILNRVGAVGLVWGAMSEKAVSIGNGVNRLGIPVILGPQGIKYRKELRGDVENPYENNSEIFEYERKNLGLLDRWKVYNTTNGEIFDSEPAPLHLSYAAKTKEEVMILISKLTLRPGDNTRGRSIKLSHYIDIYRKYSGKGKDAFPDDLDKFIRMEGDVPMAMADEVKEFLKSKNWKIRKIVDPTIVRRMANVK